MNSAAEGNIVRLDIGASVGTGGRRSSVSANSSADSGADVLDCARPSVYEL